jgi:CubicO group peptidase (beta-lactamase class C family)
MLPSLRCWRRASPLPPAPDTQYEYSNLGYMILGRVVAQVAGMSFQHYVDTHILQPLGMTTSCWNVDARTQASWRAAIDWSMGCTEDALAFAPSGGDAAAFGGLYASVEDLARWVAFFLDAWPPRDGDEGTVLRRSSRREMQRCANLRLPMSGGQRVGAPVRYEAGGYGYGLFAWLSSDLGRIVGHAGGLPGFGSHMLWLPDHDLGVVTLANLTYAPAVPIAVQILRSLVATTGMTPRPVRPPPRWKRRRRASPACLRHSGTTPWPTNYSPPTFFWTTPRTAVADAQLANCAPGTAHCATPAPSRQATRCVGRGRCKASVAGVASGSRWRQPCRRASSI